jgi:hypothetical protein
VLLAFLSLAANSPNLAQADTTVAAYAWAHQETGTYTVDPSFASPSGTTVTQLSTGSYEVRFPGAASGQTSGGNAHVTAYGSGTQYCKVSMWTSSGADILVRVRCFAPPSAAAANFRFVVHFNRGIRTPSLLVAYVWNNLLSTSERRIRISN